MAESIKVLGRTTTIAPGAMHDNAIVGGILFVIMEESAWLFFYSATS